MPSLACVIDLMGTRRQWTGLADIIAVPRGWVVSHPLTIADDWRKTAANVVFCAALVVLKRSTDKIRCRLTTEDVCSELDILTWRVNRAPRRADAHRSACRARRPRPPARDIL